jgi:diadenosine tetraphosphate (Ap4A) HIT family hydrolase
MPYHLSREDALATIAKEPLNASCLVCGILQHSSTRVLEKKPFTTAILSAYPRTWGQVMVVTNRHIESISATKEEEYVELMSQIKKWTTCIETALHPLRCYVVSLGAINNQPHTCPHLHFNILPVYQATDTPEYLLTWKHGLVGANENEWQELVGLLTNTTC